MFRCPSLPCKEKEKKLDHLLIVSTCLNLLLIILISPTFEYMGSTLLDKNWVFIIITESVVICGLLCCTYLLPSSYHHHQHHSYQYHTVIVSITLTIMYAFTLSGRGLGHGKHLDCTAVTQSSPPLPSHIDGLEWALDKQIELELAKSQTKSSLRMLKNLFKFRKLIFLVQLCPRSNQIKICVCWKLNLFCLRVFDALLKWNSSWLKYIDLLHMKAFFHLIVTT